MATVDIKEYLEKSRNRCGLGENSAYLNTTLIESEDFRYLLEEASSQEFVELNSNLTKNK